MSVWPTMLESQVCRTPRVLVMTATAIMPRAISVTRVTSRSGMAWSSSSRSRNGDASAMTALKTMIAVTTAMRARYGRKRLRTRRTGAGSAVVDGEFVGGLAK